MKDIAIVVDSACGLDKIQAEKHGFYFLPLQIQMDGLNYNDGIDINSSTFFDKFNLNTKGVKTSATPIGYSENLIEELSNKYKQVVIFPISQHLSSQYSFLKIISDKYQNVHVVESVDVAQTILFRVNKFITNLEKLGLDNSIKLASIWNDSELDITLVPKYNDYLVKGGRLSKPVATLAKLLKIVPLIRFQNGTLEKQGKGRLFLKSLQNALDEKMQKFSSDDEIILLGQKTSEAKELLTYLEQKYQVKTRIFPIPNVISIHTGPEAIVILKGTKLKTTLEKYFNNENI